MKRCYSKFTFFILLFAAVLFSTAQAQIITNFAGSGYSGPGDGGPATAAQLVRPVGVVADSAGNVYISDPSAFRVRKVNTAGIISTIAGTGTAGFSGDGGPASVALLGLHGDVAVDRAGNIYIIDHSNFRIRKIDTAGIIRTIAGNGVNASTGDGGPASAASIRTISGISSIAVDAVGNIYLPGDTGSSIRKINTAGIINTVIGTGVPGYSGDGGPASVARFNGIQDFKTDYEGNIYICDMGNYRIRKVDTAGIVTTIAGNGIPGFSGDGGPATAAQLNRTNGVMADVAGNVYICDYYNSRCRKVNSLGIISTIIGNGIVASTGDGGPATAASLNYICHMAKYGSGNIYVADRNGYRVRMVTDTNHAVRFTGGHTLVLNVCAASVSIDGLLAGADTDTGQVERWNLMSGPVHGTASANYVTYTTGGVIMPAGLTYSPAPGYVGYDTFKVRITDGYTADTTYVYVRVDTAMPYAGIVTGTDSVCTGQSITLTGTAAGGVWSGSTGNTTIAGSLITGVTAGSDTIRYIIINGCGADTALHPLTVKACVNETPFCNPAMNELLRLYPNPAREEMVIEYVITGDALLQITDIAGRIIAVKKLSGNKKKEVADIHHFPQGMYLYKVIQDGLPIATGQVLKE